MTQECVLIVDGDPNNRDTLCTLLGAENYRILQAKDGILGLQLIQEENPSLVILDAQVPETGSIQILQALKDQNSAASVLFMIGPDDQHLAVQAFQLGVQGMIAKPLVLEEMAQAIKSVWHRRAVDLEHRYLRAALQEMEEGMVILDHQLNILYYNPLAGAALGLLSNMIGQPAVKHFHYSTLQDLLLAAKMSGEKYSHAEIRIQDNWVYGAYITALEEIGYVLVMQDITQLKELDRIKTEFISTISHDMRTPLTTIRGYIDLLNRVGPLNDSQEDLLERVRGGAIHITNLIDDLLDLSRIESDYDVEMEPLHIENIVDAVVDDIRPLLERKGRQLEWEFQELSLIRGNPQRLRRTIENLISNAIKYTQDEGRITIEAAEEEQHIVIHVADNGMGIPLEEQPRIFDRFYRASTAESNDVPGTGLGLAIVKSVIESHGGRIWVTSRPGAGSVFTFVLPTLKNPTAV